MYVYAAANLQRKWFIGEKHTKKKCEREYGIKKTPESTRAFFCIEKTLTRRKIRMTLNSYKKRKKSQKIDRK